MSAFTPPGLEERLQAIGPTNRLPDLLRRTLEPRADFAPLPQPRPSDWLANHPESGQSFGDFLRSRARRPDRQHHKLYLQPLGEFIASASPSLAQLQTFAAAFFALDVNVLPVLDIAGSGVTTRLNPLTHNRQLLTTDILALLRRRMSHDAYAVLGITMDDLYPDPSWNFVFGQASLHEGVGVYSFRNAPAAKELQGTGARDDAHVRRPALHLFSLPHERLESPGRERCSPDAHVPCRSAQAAGEHWIRCRGAVSTTAAVLPERRIHGGGELAEPAS